LNPCGSRKPPGANNHLMLIWADSLSEETQTEEEGVEKNKERCGLVISFLISFGLIIVTYYYLIVIIRPIKCVILLSLMYYC